MKRIKKTVVFVCFVVASNLLTGQNVKRYEGMMRWPSDLEQLKDLGITRIHDGEVFRVDLLSIPLDYMTFVYNLSMSMGSNPMMGPPTNVITNIQPSGEAVGWFYAASVVSKEMIYHKEN